MSIANDIIVFFSIIILITSCCPNTVKNRIDLRIPEDEKLWIPNINSPITYINQDGELAIFDKVTTEIEYRETDLCGPESCCDEIYSLETKRLTLAKSDENINYQIHLEVNLDIISTLGIAFINNDRFNASSKYPPAVYFTYVSPTGEMDSNEVSKLKYFDSLSLNNKVFYKVYKFSGYPMDTDASRTYQKELYFTINQGIVGIAFSDSQVWTLN